MRILHILSSDDQYGSALCFLELLQCELKYEKIVPIVVTPKNNKINEKCNELKVKNYVVDYGQLQIPKHDKFYIFILKYIYHSGMYYLKNIKAEKKILEIVKKEKIDIIHTNSCVIDIGAIVAKKANLINVWHLRELGKQDFNFYSVRYNFIKRMNGDNNKFIAISKIVKQTWNERGIDSSKIQIIYDGVDAKQFIPNHNVTNNEKLKMVMCGSFCEAKGQKILVEAVNKLRSSEKNKLIIDFYGKTEGKYYEEVKELIQKYNLYNIFYFKGYVNNVPNILNKYDIGVLCSRSEAFGRVTVEYMMTGLCTIAPDSGASIELIPKKCGIIYKTGNSNELSNVLDDIINGRVDYSKIGNSACNIALDNYDINKNATKIITYFLTLNDRQC